ncbi:MAG: hypothetical protein UY92_C0006G0107 [Candidatus Magasanikbacteria bacterium GW2011_GWA2_56_11]|uniref:Uncharacterized protein n=1 Tax=Candidatus Magasanikbacteria bacterium GW2011_GWA2_56_11 TaxID=1619044 RepID=A0A0G1YH25_9BACT|nr:MAG: hypothetical protein UY92_C0006G0107 [Candidatus Magasanikbacteria bacterium GW2011_GWA2_56_11]
MISEGIHLLRLAELLDPVIRVFTVFVTPALVVLVVVSALTHYWAGDTVPLSS